ncbi:hypothetical protein [Nonomuraea sp. NPDC002799]
MRVLGFGFALLPEPFGKDNDRLLLQGDEDLEHPPKRTLPSCSDEENGVQVERSGDHAAHRLRPATLLPAGTVEPGFPVAVDTAIPRWSPVGDFIRSLIETIVAEEHSIWLVGGAVRDLIANAGEPVNDLDFCGTMLLGTLCEVADESLALAGLGDHRRSVSPGRVFSIAPAVAARRILEYKSLSLTGFRFPASGGDLLDDVRTRDLTVNGLYYDPRHQLIIDPAGNGIEHLNAVPVRIVPLFAGDDVVEQAQVILRGLKFKTRWPEADVTALAAWVRALPGDLAGQVPEDRWRALRGMWRRCVPREHRAAAAKTAGELGPAADRLIRVLENGGSDDA